MGLCTSVQSTATNEPNPLGTETSVPRLGTETSVPSEHHRRSIHRVDAASVVFNMGEDKVLDVKDHIVKMSLSWDFFDGMKPVDMDAACVCFDSDGKFLDICFYNRLSIYDEVITHSGDSRDGKKDGWDEQITVDLTKAADKCQVMVFSVLIHGDGNFTNVESSKAALLDTDGQTLVESWLGSAGEYTAHTFSVLYYSLDDYEWHYREINANSGGRSVRAILPVTKRAVGLAEPRLAEAMEKTAYHGEMDTLDFFKCIAFSENRDYGIIVDKSLSMWMGGGTLSSTRWKAAEKAVEYLAPKVTAADADGITLYFFSSSDKFRRFPNVTSAEAVKAAWSSQEPDGETDLAHALKCAFEDRGSKPMTLLIITDGMPDYKEEVMQRIIDVSKTIRDNSELSISFIQIGDNSGAEAFLATLDDDLVSRGAPFDIVDKLTCKELHGLSFNELIEKSLAD